VEGEALPLDDVGADDFAIEGSSGRHLEEDLLVGEQVVEEGGVEQSPVVVVGQVVEVVLEEVLLVGQLVLRLHDPAQELVGGGHHILIEGEPHLVDDV
jgi:hypothetical protein